MHKRTPITTKQAVENYLWKSTSVDWLLQPIKTANHSTDDIMQQFTKVVLEHRNKCAQHQAALELELPGLSGRVCDQSDESDSEGSLKNLM